jgi:para-nitrobenzyl esterase
LYVAPDRAEIDGAELERQAREYLPRRSADRVGEVIALYRESRVARGLPATNNDISDAIATASRFRFPATQLAEAQATHRPKTFMYQVDWESPARGGALGACHAIEIPFVFGTVGKTGNDRMSGTGPDAERLAEQMMDAWIAFARSGEPGHDGIGEWPAYDTTDRQTMIFGRRCGAQPAPFEEERAVWESMITRR